ncbi:MAG: tRNA (N6-isopentenyl adenosine(37)-C2)-methylthiotransferase MiaB [Candidatus Kuenenbacteria bacterium]
MFYKLITFGCQMNISDSERITTVLKKMKYQPTLDEKKADLILINSCSVRQNAINRIFGQERKWRKLKKLNPLLIIALTGCITEKDKKNFKNKVDLIFDIKELPNLKSLLNSCSDDHQSLAKRDKINLTGHALLNNYLTSPDLVQQISSNRSHKTKQNSKQHYLHIKPIYSNKTIAYVPIMTGCDNFCSYCVVPYTRGREISRPFEKILKEIKNLIKKKYKEICLLGQNVNSYFSKSQTKNFIVRANNHSLQNKIINFPKLLEKINNLSGEFQISFFTSHPKDMSDELIDTMAECKKIKKELHLPIQSGDDEILKKMNRKYTVENYLKLVQKIRKKIKKIFLSTDIIVGFPGETKKQFENTVKLCKKIKFNKAYISQYSPRPGTLAAKLNDDISKEEKKRRWKILDDLINKKNAKINKIFKKKFCKKQNVKFYCRGE